MRSLALSLLMMVVAAAGCATALNTPGQDPAWERWRACDHFTTLTLDRIDLDGRIIVNTYENNAAPFTACVHTAAGESELTPDAKAQFQRDLLRYCHQDTWGLVKILERLRELARG